MRKKIFYLGKIFLKHELVSGSTYVFMGAIVSNILAFLLNLFLVRKLTTSDYGIYASLLSFFTLMAIPAQSLTVIIVKFSASFFAKGDIEDAKLLYRKLLKIFILLFIFIFLLFIASALPIKNFLNIDNIWYIIILGLSISLVYLSLVNLAFLQSLLRFRFISTVFIAGAFIRLMTAVSLVYFGFKVFGALWAILLASLLPFILGFIPLRFLLINNSKGVMRTISIRQIIYYGVPTAVTILSLSSFTSIDVILVKHFSDPRQAGLYAGLSLVGKVIFYFTGPITSVMFPLLIKRQTKGEKFRNLFYFAVILIAVPSFFIVLFYFLFPQFVIRIFLGGGEYVKISSYLGIFGIFLAIFSILNVLVNFFLSLNKTKIAWIVLFFALLQVLFIVAFHNTFTEIILVSILTSSLLLFFLLLYYYKEFIWNLSPSRIKTK